MDDDGAHRARAAKFGRLPARVQREDLVEEQDTEPPHDPDGGRDPERDFMIRWAGGG